MLPLRRSALVLSLATIACRPEPPSEAPVAAPVVAEPAPAPAPQPEFVELDVETGFGCALHRAGTIHCWGDDPAVRLGLRRPTAGWTVASQVEGIPRAIDIATNFLWACAVTEQGEVLCWGEDSGMIHERVTIPIKNAVEVASHGETCARTQNLGVFCWSVDDPQAVRYVFDAAIDIDVGALSGCAIDADGGVWCWSGGEPDANESREHRLSAIKVAEVPGAVEVEVGVYDYCVRSEDGRVQCAEAYRRRMEPLEAPAGLATSVALGWGTEHGCAVLDDGGVSCFGANGWAALGDGSSTPHEQAVRVPGLINVFDVAASDSTSCAIDLDGIACWGTRMTEPFDQPPTEISRPITSATGLAIDGHLTCASSTDGGIRCWGASSIGHLVEDPRGILGASTPTRLGLDGVGAVRKISNGCILDDRGELRCGSFGDHRFRFTVNEEPFAVTQQFDNVTDFASGTAECVLSKGKLRCTDHYGEHAELKLPKLRKPTAVAGEFSTFYVIHDKGKLVRFEIVRKGDSYDVSPLTRFDTLPPIKALFDINAFGACAIDEQGKIWCWRLAARSDVPIEITGLPPAEEAAGLRDHMCVRTSDARVACMSERDRKLVWLDANDVVELADGDLHMCMRQADGTVTCVGENSKGQLGVVSPLVMATPVRIEL